MNKKKLTRAFIVDDSHDAVELLRRMLESNYSVEVVGTAFDAEEAAAKIVNTDPDLIFLDVELPTMSGLEFCTMIRNELKPETKVVFYTGHDKYMLEAIRRQAFDYLLKPPTEQELSQIMTRYYENKLTGIPQSAHAENHLPLILVVNALNEHLTLRLSECAFFRYNQDRKLWEIVCKDNTSCILRHRTTSDIILNYSPDFVQIHKRYIVNINQIKMIQDNTCILAEPLEEIKELKISKNYRHDLMAAFYSM
jgi:two-component system LytT family response regulator